ncbi:branched-chain amino acid aminotransferase [Pseudoneobacillus rhizosphaerae]|uniref:Branched-chain amino acid aminotransferase n=1 Tax=Pseudoneobacillus rhizosphaerae TaxID=2880968 RepID=A0A9C7L8Z4_9BACI|nr:branched-chain amino acid aminotransferase [Pseudoneobacillus rhizosphaerae]CAG9606372.1 hypothetical protein NEOCIP111885_00060 [Pseudoneobacillus rhizosphaerae]
MLNKQMKNLIDSVNDLQKLELFTEEKDYLLKHGLIEADTDLVLNSPELRFVDAYIERSDKESEEVIGEEGHAFLDQPLQYLKKHMNEFIYLESNWFEIIGVDAVSLEVDDLFGAYDVMLGLKLQKKFESSIKMFLIDELGSDEKFDLMFSLDDGLWNLNFDLDSVFGFSEALTLGEAFRLIYQFLFRLAEAVEEGKKG